MSLLDIEAFNKSNKLEIVGGMCGNKVLLNINILEETPLGFGHPTNLSLDQICIDFWNEVGYGFWFGLMSSIRTCVPLFKHVDIFKIGIKD